MWIQFSIQLYSKHISSHCNALWGVSKIHCDFTPQMHIKKIAKSKGGQLGRKKTIFWRHPFYILCHLLSVKQGFFNGSWLLFPSKKIPSEMEVAPRYKLLTLLTLLTWLTLLTLLTLFILLKLLYTAKTLACMPWGRLERYWKLLLSIWTKCWSGVGDGWSGWYPLDCCDY